MVCWGQTLNIVIGFILFEAIFLLSFITPASLALRFFFYGGQPDEQIVSGQILLVAQDDDLFQWIKRCSLAETGEWRQRNKLHPYND